MIHIYKWVYWLMRKTRIYSLWSKLYRFIYHRKYRKISLDGPFSPDEALVKIRLLTWSKDSVKEFWDAIGSPHWVQYCINQVAGGNPQPKGALDCDEFAIWSANVLARSYNPRFLNIVWKTEHGFDGHNVCLFNDMSGYRHIGNWGLSNKFFSIETLVKRIVNQADEDAKPVGFSIYTSDLKLLECHVYTI